MTREIRIGLTLLGSVLALYLTVTWLKSSHLFSANQIEYRIQFENVAGLREGDPVRVHGYPAGKVEAIDLGPQGAVVTVRVNPDIALHRNAVAEIQIKELMGGKMIEIRPGSGAPLAAGGMISGTATLDFSTAFAKFGEFADRFDGQELDSLLINMNRLASAFADVGEQLDLGETKTLMRNLSASAEDLRLMMDEVQKRRLIAQLDKTFATVDQLAQKAGHTMEGVDKLTATLDESTLPQASELMEQMSHMLTEAEEMLADTKDLLDKVKDKQTVIGKIFNDPAFAEELDATLENLNVTLTHLRTKKIYVSMSLSKRQKKFEEAVEGEDE